MPCGGFKEMADDVRSATIWQPHVAMGENFAAWQKMTSHRWREFSLSDGEKKTAPL
jgi:hypothetical protein